MIALDTEVFVEFGVGIAGFSAVVVAFARPSGQLSDYDRYRVVQLLLAALTPAFLGLLPGILDAFDITGSSQWRTMSAVAGAWVFSTSVFAVHSSRQLAPEARASLSPAVWRFTMSGHIVALAWLASNLLEWPFPVSPGPVLATMSWMLLVACVLFLRLLLVRFNERGAA